MFVCAVQLDLTDDAETTRQLLSQARMRGKGELGKYISETRQLVRKMLDAATKAAEQGESVEQEGGESHFAKVSPAEKSEGARSPSGQQGLTGDDADSEATEDEMSETDKTPQGVTGDRITPDAAGAEQQDEYDLLGVPDGELDEVQRKAKRRQQLVKASREAHARARARRQQEEQEKVVLAGGCLIVVPNTGLFSVVQLSLRLLELMQYI